MLVVCAAYEAFALRSMGLVRAANDAVVFVRKSRLEAVVALGLHSWSSFDNGIIGNSSSS